jgi:hypothetical protein
VTPLADRDHELQEMLHRFFHPLVSRGVGAVHSVVSPLLQARQAHGWRSPLSSRMDRAFSRFARSLGAQDPALATEAREALDLVLALSELERELFPRWLEELLNDLILEGALAWNDKAKRLEVNTKR